MKQLIVKRAFLAAGLGLGAGLCATSALAQIEQPLPGRKPGTDMLGRSPTNPLPRQHPPNRMARTSKLFITPSGYPNCIATDPDGKGFWIAEQRHDGRPEAVWLVDFNGKLLKTIHQGIRDCTGMTVGTAAEISLERAGHSGEAVMAQSAMTVTAASAMRADL